MSDTALEFVLRRDRVVVAAALGLLTVLCWAYMLWLVVAMNAGMSQGTGAMPAQSTPSAAGMLSAMKPWTLSEFVLMFVMWAVMMVGMMTPSAAPMILLYARVGRQARQEGKPLAATAYFAGGYLFAWTVFSLIATLGQWGLERALLLDPMMTSANGFFSGIVLMAAGIFQWSPQKRACLKHCQAPMAFIQAHGGLRKDGWGSFAIGVRHGAFCIGCCWALMALLFVGGVMNILWIAAIAIFVLAEKVIPTGHVVSRLAGILLVAAGVWMLLETTT